VGNITGGNILGGANVNAASHTGTTVSVSGNITGGNILGGANVNATTHTGTTVSVTGNITAGNLIISGAIQDSAQLDIQTTTANANIVLTPNGTGNVNTGANVSVTGNIQGGNLRTAGLISATGAITGAAITGTSLTVSTGNITGGNIVNAGTTGVGNIGNATVGFNTVFAKATSAQYADLAEYYAADAEYKPGTVLSFGGAQEVTIATHINDVRVAGVVSTNPAYAMNTAIEAAHTVALALTGRVPTLVVGAVAKGDMMVTAGGGRAKACATPTLGTVIGKAVQDHPGGPGMIEIVVGRL
jgi:hypothetical protein